MKKKSTPSHKPLSEAAALAELKKIGLNMLYDCFGRKDSKVIIRETIVQMEAIRRGDLEGKGVHDALPNS